MDWIMLVIAFILVAILMFMMVCIGYYAAKQEEPKNRVHFYVARDKNGELWLYMGKPIREEDIFDSCPEIGIRPLIGHDNNLKLYGLKEKDYANLKWEDEPVEVFINMED